MMLAFTLTMPGRASWDGRWSGDGQKFVRVRTIRGRRQIQALSLLGFHHYHWCDDGWTACIEVTQVTTLQACTLRKQSVGFYGYDWMIDSLLNRGVIEP
jgi:hypothetical protein